MMRRVLVHLTSAALLCLPMAGTSAAQAPKPDPSVTTIVGCLVQGNPSAPKSGDYFVRTPTVAVPAGATIAVGKPGTTSTATSSGKPAPDSYYRITGMGGDQMRPHLGHKVEVQGHLSARKPDAAAGGVNSTKTTVDAAGKATVTVETRVDVAGDLHTTNLKMVSATCP
jgi:hypothetical protein